VVTTVHERQVVEESVAVDDHDVPLGFVVTPDRTIQTETPYDRPEGIDWDALSDERTAEIPVLERFRVD
jgi:5-formyltetrahydrofolate cyclo-ligase